MATDGVTAEQIAAARLRLVLDAKLGRTTPDRIRRIAAMAGADDPAPPGEFDRLAARKWFEDQVTPEVLAQIGAAGRTAWLLMVDVDAFGELNASAGYEAGDAVLREIDRLLAREAGTAGLIARTGGDEFVAVVTAASDEPDAGTGVAERVRAAVAAHDWRPVLGGDRRPSLSVGVIAVRSGEQFQEALSRADRAVHVAKQLGGDRVVQDSGEPTRHEHRP